jgi:sulfite reductase alpha subunit-like flavoprotein
MYKILPDLNRISATQTTTEFNQIYHLLEPSQAESFSAHESKAYDADFGLKKWKGFKTGKIVRIYELRTIRTHELSTLLIDIEIDHHDSYQLAQNIVIYPQNTLPFVERAEKYLGIDGHSVVVINPLLTEDILTKFKQSFPNVIPLRTILKEFIDLRGTLKYRNKKNDLEKNPRISRSRN